MLGELALIINHRCTRIATDNQLMVVRKVIYPSEKISGNLRESVVKFRLVFRLMFFANFAS